MTTRPPRPSREIDGKGRTVRELLAGRKYSIDYYQREYKWQQKQVAELIDDLADKFLESHEEGHERSAVADYGHYFLGSIIISDKDGQKFIIDGQQRLTTLTLLLIFLHHQLEDAEQKGQIADLIFSQKYGKQSFNLDVPERTACMEALYKGEEFVETPTRPSPSPTSSPATPTSRSSSRRSSQGTALAVLRRLAHRERASGRDHRLLRRRRLHDLRDDERPRAVAHARGHAQGLPARQHHRRREAHAREPRLEGARAGARRARQGRGRRRHQVVAAQPVRREHPRAQARRRRRRTST